MTITDRDRATVLSAEGDEPVGDDALATAVKRCAAMMDLEEAHLEADRALLRELLRLGYGDTVREFLHMNRWYA